MLSTYTVLAYILERIFLYVIESVRSPLPFCIIGFGFGFGFGWVLYAPNKVVDL